MKYSVIIPAFNAETTLQRCLDSIVSQINGDVEIIIVNDGSTDLTDKICKSYISSYSCITYYDKHNAGVAAARNDGIRLANGDYIVFVDSDDYLESGFFQVTDKLLEEYPYDLILLSNYYERMDSRRLAQNQTVRCKARLDSFKIISGLIVNKKINAPWAKIYNAKLVKEHGVIFTPGVSIGEDRAFNIKYSLFINSIAIDSFPGYIVSLDNGNSLSRGRISHLKDNLKIADIDIQEKIKAAGLGQQERKYITDAMNFCTYGEIYSDAKRLYKERISRRDRYVYIRRECKIINSKKLSFPHTRYALLIVIPIKLRLVFIIDKIGQYLAKK